MKSRGCGFLSAVPLVLLALGVFDPASALAQGRVLFNNQVAGTVISHVYLPLAASPGLLQIGDGTGDYPAGTTDWTRWSPVIGAGFSAQLFAAPGADVPVDSLAPAFPITTFLTGAAAGFVYPVTATLTGVPPFAPMATVQMRVWENRGGTIADWATALAQPTGTELVGVSAPINVGPPGTIFDDRYLIGLQSFNLTYVPGPSAFALAGLGALILWFISSRKLMGKETILPKWG